MKKKAKTTKTKTKSKAASKPTVVKKIYKTTIDKRSGKVIKINMTGLRPWKKGQSGNPNGRPPKLPDLQKLLAKILGGSGGDEVTVMEQLIKNLANDAKNKRSKTFNRSAEVLLDRAYGKAKNDVVPEDEDPMKSERVVNVVIMDNDRIKKLKEDAEARRKQKDDAKSE